MNLVCTNESAHRESSPERQLASEPTLWAISVAEQGSRSCEKHHRQGNRHQWTRHSCCSQGDIKEQRSSPK